jgi:hypothetical protein
MAYTFARLGMSVTCLVIFKVRLFAVNYRQTCTGCEWLKNKGLATKLSADPLDRRLGVGKTGADWGIRGPTGERLDWRADRPATPVRTGEKAGAFWSSFGAEKGRFGGQKSRKIDKNREKTTRILRSIC